MKRGRKANVKPDTVSGSRQGGPAGNKRRRTRVSTKERIIARQLKAWELLKFEGLTVAQTAKRLGVSTFTAHQDVEQHARRLENRAAESTETRRQQIDAGLQSIYEAHHPNRRKVEPAKVLLQVLKQSEQLHGAAKPKEGTYTESEVVGALRALIAELIASFPDVEHRRRIALVFRKRFGGEVGGEVVGGVGLAPTTQIDVLPKKE